MVFFENVMETAKTHHWKRFDNTKKGIFEISHKNMIKNSCQLLIYSPSMDNLIKTFLNHFEYILICNSFWIDKHTPVTFLYFYDIFEMFIKISWIVIGAFFNRENILLMCFKTQWICILKNMATFREHLETAHFIW